MICACAASTGSALSQSSVGRRSGLAWLVRTRAIGCPKAASKQIGAIDNFSVCEVEGHRSERSNPAFVEMGCVLG